MISQILVRLDRVQLDLSLSAPAPQRHKSGEGVLNIR